MKRLQSKIWFSADQHFRHNNILRYNQRPFSSVEDMERCLLAYHRKLVHPFDTVYWLGDLAWGGTIPYNLKSLPGTKYLILGNHDKAAIENYSGVGIKSVQTFMEIDYCGEKILLTHDPVQILYLVAQEQGFSIKGLSWDSPLVRMLVEFLPHKIFCGHVHRLFRRYGQIVNIGVDVWGYCPVAIEEALSAYHEPSNVWNIQHHKKI